MKCNKDIVNSLLFAGRFGIEKESLRVDEFGRLAQTPHPQLDMKHISMDFSESQVEFISDVHESIHKAGAQICILEDQIEDEIRDRKTGSEYIWTYSNPPEFCEEEIKVASFEGITEEKTNYREYLAKKYGKTKMLYSGVHLNFSLPISFFEAMYPEQKNCLMQKNEWYLSLANRIMSDDWLIVALTAASPVASKSMLSALGIEEEQAQTIASFRNSEFGYWNHFIPQLSYENYEAYLDSMECFVRSNEIDSIQELYYPVRLKPAGENTLQQLREKGISHIELRMLDLNPMVCAGVEKRDLMFCHLLIVFRLWEMTEEVDTTLCFSSDSERIVFHQKAARLDFWKENPEYKDYGIRLLHRIKVFYDTYKDKWKDQIPVDYDGDEVIRFQLNKINHPEYSYGQLLKKRYQNSYMETRMKETRGEQ